MHVTIEGCENGCTTFVEESAYLFATSVVNVKALTAVFMLRLGGLEKYVLVQGGRLPDQTNRMEIK